MEKNKISAYFLFISVFTLITIFFIVVQKSYSNLLTPTVEVKKNDLLKPVDPSLEISVLDDIEQRKYYSLENQSVIPTDNLVIPQ